MAKVKAHVSEEKKRIVSELAKNMKRRTIMIFSIKEIPCAQFQDIKKKIRQKAMIMVAKKSLIDFALDHSGIAELHELVPYVQDSTAILFSDEDAFEIAAMLYDEKSPTKAKAGQIAPFDIEVKAGPTDLLPGPDISALSSVGLTPKVEGGKISILKDKVIVKKGEVISEKVASIMAKLNIVPFKIGVEPIAALCDRKLYTNIKIDKEETLKALEDAYSRALPFALEIGYVCPETLDYMLAIAKSHEAVINRIITGEPEPQQVSFNNKQAQEETKQEEPKGESTIGLASLFG